MISMNKGKGALLVGGTWVAFDYYYIYVFRDDIKKMKLRNENSFFRIIKFVENLLSGKEVNKEEFIKNNIPIDSNTLKDDLPKADPNVDMDSVDTAIPKKYGLI